MLIEQGYYLFEETSNSRYLAGFVNRVELSVNKLTVNTSDPTDEAEIVATVRKYNGELQTDPIRVTFEVAGQMVNKVSLAGIASITFHTEVLGKHVIKTTSSSLQNAEITIEGV